MNKNIEIYTIGKPSLQAIDKTALFALYEELWNSMVEYYEKDKKI